MPLVPADLRIEVRWIVPMTARNEVLEDHSLVVRDGRILDILPSAEAIERYSVTAVLQRTSHLAMPGMINAQADASMRLLRGAHPAAAESLNADFARDGVMAAIAEMLKSGITCFYDRSWFPEETARMANEQGIRAVLGMPITEAPTPWANGAAPALTRALSLRDKHKDDPLVSTLFAPHPANALSDATFARLATLADELDAGIMLDLHQSSVEISACMAAYNVRPIERLWHLGLLTPALSAVHMVQLNAADVSLAQRTGISITVCPQSNLVLGNGLAPIGTLGAAGIRLGLGSGSAALGQDIWGDMRLMGLVYSPWDALRAATRGGAAVLGLDDEVGTLEVGKWADLCCLDLSGPATQPVADPPAQLVFSGGRDMVSDVWVAGRQLLSGGELTRLDWADVAARSAAWAVRMKRG
jgi:5-methylthioadenosine/S-adenosylhomocysteine deaminase